MSRDVAVTRDLALPPQVTGVDSYVLASQGHVVASIDAASGQLVERCDLGGASQITASQNVLYLTVSNERESAVEARHCADFKLLWRFATQERLRLAPPFIANGCVYVCGQTRDVFALRQDDGSLVWQMATDGRRPSIPTSFDHKICLILSPRPQQAQPPEALVLDSVSGDIQVRYAVSGDSRPSVWSTDAKLILIERHACRAINVWTGASAWQSTMREKAACKDLVIGKGVIYLIVRETREEGFDTQTSVPKWQRMALLRAVRTEDGATLWEHAIGQEVEIMGVTSPLVTQSNAIFASTNDGHLASIRTQTGEVIWTRFVGGKMLSSPAVMANRVIVGTDTGQVVALSTSDGNRIWDAFVNASASRFYSYAPLQKAGDD